MSLLNRALDGSVVFSFDHTGYQRHAARFVAADTDVDLTGKVAVVTGANSGLGYATATALARRGASTWLLCRDAGRGEAARDAIRRATGNEDVHLAVADMVDLDSIAEFAEDFEPRRVDILVHNAGALPSAREETGAGVERALATNVIGPFYLTARLLRKLGKGSRVITVSSGGMYTQRLNIRELQRPAEPYDGVLAYAQTKRAGVVLSELWGEKLRAKGVLTASLHPGWADTPAVQSSLPRFWKVTRSILRTPEEGADTVVFLACCPDLAQRAGTAGQDGSGLFWFDREPVTTHRLPWTRETETARADLWALCIQLCPEDINTLLRKGLG